MYNEYEFASAMVSLTDCDSLNLGSMNLDISSALSEEGDVNSFILNNEIPEYVCLQLTGVKDSYGNDITINSYHKIKFK